VLPATRAGCWPPSPNTHPRPIGGGSSRRRRTLPRRVVEHGQARGARSPLSPGFAQVAVTVLTAASGGTASTAVLLAQVARLTRTVAELHAVQSRVAAARDTARAAELLAPYATPTAPIPDPVPPQRVIMPNQEQLDAMLGSTRAQRFAAETRNRTRGGEPSIYRPPPPTQEPGRER